MCFMVQNVPHGLEKPLILGGYLTDLAVHTVMHVKNAISSAPLFTLSSKYIFIQSCMYILNTISIWTAERYSIHAYCH